MSTCQSRIVVRVVDETTRKNVAELVDRVELERMWDLGTLEGWTSFRAKGMDRAIAGRRKRRGSAEVVTVRHASPWLVQADLPFGQTRRRATPAFAVVFPGERVELTVSVVDIDVLIRRHRTVDVTRDLNRQDAACTRALLRAMPRAGTYGAVRGLLSRPRARKRSTEDAHVHVLGPDGTATDGIEATVRFEDDQVAAPWTVVPVRPGPRRIVVAQSRHELWTKDVVVEPGRIVDVGRVRAAPGRRRMRIQVVDERGRPVTEVPVYAWSVGATMRWQGAYLKRTAKPVVIRDIPSDGCRLKLHIEKRGYGRTYADVSVQRKQATVTLEPLDDSGFVECRIVDNGGADLEGARVFHVDKAIDVRRYAVTTGADPRTGRLRLAGLPGRLKTVRLRAECRGFRPRTVAVPLGRADVVITLRRTQ